MSEVALEKLNEAERICVDHLRQAQELGVSLAEYCRSFDLDLAKWYRVKQALSHKGVTVTAAAVAAVAVVPNVDDCAAEEWPREFARVNIVPPPVAVTAAPVACRIVHPSGWVVECGVLPQAAWLAAVLAGQRP